MFSEGIGREHSHEIGVYFQKSDWSASWAKQIKFQEGLISSDIFHKIFKWDGFIPTLIAPTNTIAAFLILALVVAEK